MTDRSIGSFPVDDYTPYGYLNLPGHTRRLTPRGVMRSNGVGFQWHSPALATQYGGRQERYRAGFRVAGPASAEDVPAAAEDVTAAAEDVTVPYHSSNVFTFEQGPSSEAVISTWFMASDDCLCVRITASERRSLSLVAEYERVVSADGEWGESGLVGRLDGDGLVLQSFEDGEAFVICCLGRVLGATFPDGSAPPVTVLGKSQESVRLAVDLTIDGDAETSWVLMARGNTVDAALSHLLAADDLAALLDARKAADGAFWQNAPILAGDWPDHWRRGIVYDLETLRMMIKEPIGIYQHCWDAMQIQAPRTVLGETAMDALALSWAAPEVSAALLLGTFADAPLPNVPCSREDGSYNMVSADGTVCGTGPQWGYPFLAAERIAQALDDPEWVRAIYPRLAAFLDWWLEKRRDSDGSLVHACSWESGQDLSPRFGDQPLGGGHPTWHLRPVDLQAAGAHAAQVMMSFAELAAPEDVSRWQAIARDLSARTLAMWRGGRFADFDSLTDQPTDVDDVMLLAPLALGVATGQQAAAMQSSLVDMDPTDLVWPMFVWTPVLAAQRSGRFDVAGTLAGEVIERAYRFWDSRGYDGTTTMPGIACEYWPQHGRCGGEGYGWGAFTVELLLSAVIGLTVRSEGIEVRPQLPHHLRQVGARYVVSFTAHGSRHRLVLEPLPDESVRIEGVGAGQTVHWGDSIRRSRSELT